MYEDIGIIGIAEEVSRKNTHTQTHTNERKKAGTLVCRHQDVYNLFVVKPRHRLTHTHESEVLMEA